MSDREELDDELSESWRHLVDLEARLDQLIQETEPSDDPEEKPGQAPVPIQEKDGGDLGLEPGEAAAVPAPAEIEAVSRPTARLKPESGSREVKRRLGSDPTEEARVPVEAEPASQPSSRPQPESGSRQEEPSGRQPVPLEEDETQPASQPLVPFESESGGRVDGRVDESGPGPEPAEESEAPGPIDAEPVLLPPTQVEAAGDNRSEVGIESVQDAPGVDSEPEWPADPAHEIQPTASQPQAAAEPPSANAQAIAAVKAELDEAKRELEVMRERSNAQEPASEPPSDPAESSTVRLARGRMADKRAHALQDLEEMEAQAAAGEIDSETAQRLRDVYTREAKQAEAELGALSATEARPPAAEAPSQTTVERETEPTDGERTLFTRRSVAGIALVALAIALAIFAVTRAVGPRDPDGSAAVANDAVVDLEGFTNEEIEAVVADNPEVIPMRLALARRYVEEGDFQAALPHYMTILESGPNVEAYAYLGWMTYLSGEPEEGARLVSEALAIEEANPVALTFLAVIRLDGLGDAAGAKVLLDRLVENPHLPDDLRQTVEEMQARAAAEL